MAYGFAPPELRRKMAERERVLGARLFDRLLLQELSDVRARIVALDREKLKLERKLNACRSAKVAL